MSESERLRRLRVENRLQELAAKYGPLEPRETTDVSSDPSWGPVGSLLQRTDMPRYEEVLRLHLDSLRLERSRINAPGPQEPENQPAPQEPTKAPPAPRRVVRPAERSQAKPSDW